MVRGLPCRAFSCWRPGIDTANPADPLDPAASDLRAEPAQHALGMIARRAGLVNGRFALGEEARQEDGGLDLGAGDRERVVDALETAAPDRQRGQPSAVPAEYGRAHQAQRLRDATHGPAAQRFGSGEHRGEWLPGRQPGQETDGGARARAVKHIRRLSQAVEPPPVNHQASAGAVLDLGAQRLHAPQRRQAHFRGHPTFDLGVAIGDRGKHRARGG